VNSLVNQILAGVIESVVKELLGKSHGRTPSKRKRRQAKSTTTSPATTGRAAKPAKRQVSKRRTTASRSKQRSR
jgi:hypothetical protein